MLDLLSAIPMYEDHQGLHLSLAVLAVAEPWQGVCACDIISHVTIMDRLMVMIYR